MARAPVVIVGASLAGHRAAQAIRGAGHEGELVVLGQEARAPYTRPPLSKELLAGAQEAEACALRPGDLDVTWRLGERAVGLDLGGRRVLLERGEALAFSKLLVATGCRPRPWPMGPLDLEGIFVLREIDDALRLRAALGRTERVVIVGAGFIGCEVAATARGLGLAVTLVDVAPQPMPALGPELGARCAELHAAHGVDLRLGTGVTGFEGEGGRLTGVALEGGERVEAGVALVALGAVPNTEWLEGSGLSLQPGVVCDATLAAVGAEDVFCAGDVAAWPHPLADDEVVRIEHWTNAAEQGGVAGRNLVADPGERKPYEAVPSFWSDQYDVKVQSVGFPGRAERVRVLEASEDGARFVAVGERDGRLVAAMGFGAARRLPWYRAQVGLRSPIEEVAEAVEADPKAFGPSPADTAEAGVEYRPAVQREAL